MSEAVALLAATAAVVEEVLALAPYNMEQALEDIAGQGAPIPLPYTGSKKGVGEEVAAFIHSTMRQKVLGEFYDVTHGAGGVTIHITARERHASDINADIIAFFKALVSRTYTPEHITPARFKYLKANPVPGGSAERAIAAFVYSWRAQNFSGYKRDRKNLPALWERMKQSRSLFEGVSFACQSYEQCKPAPGSVVYADPPYATRPGGCNGWKQFDHTLFWQWVRELSVRGVFVFVSEVTAPSGFDCVWQKRMTGTFSRVERLYMHSSCRALLAAA
jgi:site-specific DNA-adenine methylase